MCWVDTLSMRIVLCCWYTYIFRTERNSHVRENSCTEGKHFYLWPKFFGMWELLGSLWQPRLYIGLQVHLKYTCSYEAYMYLRSDLMIPMKHSCTSVLWSSIFSIHFRCFKSIFCYLGNSHKFVFFYCRLSTALVPNPKKESYRPFYTFRGECMHLPCQYRMLLRAATSSIFSAVLIYLENFKGYVRRRWNDLG